MNKAFLQVILNAYETQYGTLEEIHSHRNELITKVEKESSSYLIKQIVKEIRQYEGFIDKYISLYINIDREIPPEIIEYKTYTEIETVKESDKPKTLQNIITENHPKAKWEDVLFKFPAESETISGKSEIGIKCKGENYDYLDFRELGLIKKNGEAKKEWTVFSLFVLGTVPKTKANETRQKVYISKIRTLLKNITGINDDPFLPYGNDNEWKPKFRFTRAKEAENQEYIDELKYTN